MLRFSNKTKISSSPWIMLAFVFVLSAVSANPQTQKTKSAGSGASGGDESPAMLEYRGVSIGMAADDVRKKLGSPADKGDEQDFFVFNENETAQVIYDKTRKVTAFSFDFTSAAAEAPTAKTIFGSDCETKADGSMHKLVRYPKAGYWLSYSRTAGATPLTSITFQKIDR